MIKNLVNRTVINYVLVSLGTFLASKLLIPLDVWEMVSGATTEVILILLGGGGVGAAILGAARGVIESQKSKVSINGERVELPPNVAATMTAKTAADRLIGRVDGSRL